MDRRGSSAIQPGTEVGRVFFLSLFPPVRLLLSFHFVPPPARPTRVRRQASRRVAGVTNVWIRDPRSQTTCVSAVSADAALF